LPQIETNDAGLVVFANGGIGGVLGVIDFWVDPDTLRLIKKVL
jgi:hypothetical protein